MPVFFEVRENDLVEVATKSFFLAGVSFTQHHLLAVGETYLNLHRHTDIMHDLWIACAIKTESMQDKCSYCTRPRAFMRWRAAQMQADLDHLSMQCTEKCFSRVCGAPYERCVPTGTMCAPP